MREMGFLKGMGAGLLVGLCVGMAVASENRRARRLFTGAAKTVGGVIGGIGSALGL
jgi:hypothetical protein